MDQNSEAGTTPANIELKSSLERQTDRHNDITHRQTVNNGPTFRGWKRVGGGGAKAKTLAENTEPK